jgi:hypothetical protein
LQRQKVILGIFADYAMLSSVGHKETTMRYALLALALTAFIAFSATPVLADCGEHTKTSEVSVPTTVADAPIKQSTPSGS